MKPRLLLHVCCGPCATEPLQRLAGEYAVSALFCNPNIAPEAEFLGRVMAVEKLAAAWHLPVEVVAYDHAVFLQAVDGLEFEPEGGRRCAACYRLRLTMTAARAAVSGFTCFASTLTVGPRKPAAVINPLGDEIARKHGLTFVGRDWKKQDGFRRSVAMARELGLYRQGYCGCEFSAGGDSSLTEPDAPVVI